MKTASLPIPPQPFAPLWQSAICLILTFHKLGSKRRLQTKEVLSIDTDETLIRVTKSILNCKEYTAISKLYNKIRSQLKPLVLPSSMKSGVYLIPISFTQELNDIITKGRQDLAPLIDYFCQVYPVRVAADQERLKDAYDATDYPDEETVKTAFWIEAHYITWDLPVTMVSISEAMLKKETENAQQKLEEMLAEINVSLREAMRQLVRHLRNRLTPRADGTQKAFKASTVNNLLDFLGRFDAKNLGKDTELTEVVSQAKLFLNGVSPKELRANQPLAEMIQAGMNDVEKRLDALLVSKPSRQYRFDEAA
jgi:hypothetical protein